MLLLLPMQLYVRRYLCQKCESIYFDFFEFLKLFNLIFVYFYICNQCTLLKEKQIKKNDLHFLLLSIYNNTHFYRPTLNLFKMLPLFYQFYTNFIIFS